jgi:cell division protein FtsI (penicillin-binding protein 3)
MAARRDKRARQVRKSEQALPSYRGRRYTVLAAFAVAVVALTWRAFDQQILEKDFLQSEGADRYLARVEVSSHRGLITDRRGDVLALSTPVDSIAANPRVLGQDAERMIVLAEAIGVQPERLRKRLQKYASRHFVYLRRRMPPAEASHVMAIVKAHDIPGVYKEREYKRYYPAGETVSHVVGFTNVDDAGLEGLELAYDDVLKGEPGQKLVLRDGLRQVVDDVENIRSPRAGSHLALSIDQRLQFIAYRELKAAVKRHRARSGSLVLLDVQTGEVLAMVNQPSFNPNASRSNRAGRLRNRALTDLFAPGSTMKPFAVAAALEAGVIEVDSTIDTSPGFMAVGAHKVKDSKNLEQIDVATVLRRSSNVGAAKIALATDRRHLWSTLDRLGFGRRSDVGFPGEVGGELHDYRQWARIDHATLSFGYGISVTALQLARAYGALANDGVLVPVSLLKRNDHPDGVRVFSADTARSVRRMLESVATADGTAPQAAVTGYSIAGKTGTVKKRDDEGGYDSQRYLSLFAGVAPARSPRVAMVVMLDEPRGKQYYGGQVAGPVFSTVMAATLRLMNIAPDAAFGPIPRVAAAGGGQ